jgi:CRP/FNR family transcriptional regulator, nitrogen fixation regulation protein
MFSRNAEIFGDGEHAGHVYKVVSGAVRTYKILADGRRHVVAFYFPGDIVGLAVEDVHNFSAEATTKSTLLVVKRTALVTLAASSSKFARQYWAQAVRETLKAQRHLLMLKLTAQERVVAFLLEMRERIPGKNSVELKMTRQDIADYLGLTIETVSRMLASLENTAAIEMPTSRRIVLCNRPALNRLQHPGC